MFAFLEKTVFDKLSSVSRSGAKFEATIDPAVSAAVPFMRDSGSDGSKTGVIPITGVLTQTFDFIAYLFGGGNTTYPSIIKALKQLDADPEVSEIILRIDSPGGSVNGLFSVIEAMQNTKKKMTAYVEGMAASAAYAIASQANEIIAKNDTVEVGSIGVVTERYIEENLVTLTSTDAPLKRPDPSTEEGKAQIVARLDEMHRKFVDVVSFGRSVSAEKVNSDFGRGGLMMAGAAKKAGMIDGVATKLNLAKNKKDKFNSLSDEENTAIVDPVKASSEDTPMDLNTLKEKHPSLYAEVFSKGQKEGYESAARLVNAGVENNCLPIALAGLKEGKTLSDTSIFEEMRAASLKSALGGNRAAELGNLADTGAKDPAADGGEAAGIDAGAEEVLKRLGVAGGK